jgi:hypothetical protein
MLAAASVQSHTTSGEIFRAGNCSGSKSGWDSTPGSGPMVSVMTLIHEPASLAYSAVDTPVANGRMALQRTPKRPISFAVVRVRPITPSLAVA